MNTNTNDKPKQTFWFVLQTALTGVAVCVNLQYGGLGAMEALGTWMMRYCDQSLLSKLARVHGVSMFLTRLVPKAGRWTFCSLTWLGHMMEWHAWVAWAGKHVGTEVL